MAYRKINTEQFFARDPLAVAHDLVAAKIKGNGNEGIIYEIGVFKGHATRTQHGLEQAAGVLFIPIYRGGKQVLAINTEGVEIPSVVTVRQLNADGRIISTDEIVSHLGLSKDVSDKTYFEDAGLSLLVQTNKPEFEFVSRDQAEKEKIPLSNNCLGLYRVLE